MSDKPKVGKNNPPVEYRFKKGQTANPTGRPKLSEIERIARDASRLEISEAWMDIKSKSLSELQKLLADKESPAIVMAMASALVHAIKKGDLSEVHRYYDRILGKPKQPIEVDGELQRTILILPDNGRDKSSTRPTD